MNDAPCACEICESSSQYTWRMNKAEEEIETMWKKVDAFYKMMIGTLATSLTTLVGVLVLIISNKGG